MITVVYDADCGVCQKSVGWARKRDRRGRLRFVPNDGELPDGVSPEETEHTVVVVEGARKWVRAEATARILRELGPWAALGLLLRAPGVRRLADRAYVRFARNRHRISAALGMGVCVVPQNGNSTSK